jgi:hypothetical protein
MRIPALLLCAAAATAQAPSPWSDLAVPSGINQPGVTSLGKLVHHVRGGQVDVWSAFTRAWTSVPASLAATTHQTNDWLLIQDGATWTAFAATRGRFAPLAVGAGAQLLNPITQNNDSALLVLDAGTLHAFSGFTGRWTSRAVSPAAITAVQRHTALLADGTTLCGYDSFSGQWHDIVTAVPATSLSADGTAGIAVAGPTIHGFSALRGTWSSAPGFANATFARSDDWGVFRDGSQALGFTGLRGSFASTAMGAVQTVVSEDLFGAFRTNTALQTFSAITGSWAQTPITGSTVVRTSSAVALAADPLLLVAYSAALGTFTALNLDSSAEDLAGSVIAAVARATGQPHLFSALTGAWQAAPPDALPGLPRLSTTAALLATTTGFRAFSCRTGAFVALATQNGFAEAVTGASPALVWDNTALHFFDGRRDLWLHEPRTGTGQPTVGIWRAAAMLFDGNDVVGFGTQSGTIGRIALPEPALAWRANSESLSVTMATHLLGFSALPLPTSLSQFPDFRRTFVAGAPFRLHLRLLPGEFAFLAGGTLAASPLGVPGLGTFLLDPPTASVALVLPEVDADRAVLTLPVPESAALRGALFWFQALVLPAAGLPYLTDTAQLRIG